MKEFETPQAELSSMHQIDQPHIPSDIGGLQIENELDHFSKEMRSYNVPQEIKESPSLQVIAELEFYYVDESLPHLKSPEAYSEDYKEIMIQIAETESDNQSVAGWLSESSDTQEQVIHVVNKLKAEKKELIRVKDELIASEELKVTALRHAGLLEEALGFEKEKSKKLLMHISELNEAILSSQLAAIEAEKERTAFFRGIDAELQVAAVAVSQSQQQLEQTKGQLNMIMHLEDVLLEKTRLIDSLELELSRAKNLRSSFANAMNDLIQLKSEVEFIEKENADRVSCIMYMEGEAAKKEEELQSARAIISDLNLQIKTITSEMHHLKNKTSKSVDKELQLEVEIATLRSELHKGRSRIAAAEAAKIRAMSSQSGLYLAVQQLAVEAELAKNEARRLKLELGDSEIIEVKEDDISIGKGAAEEFITASSEFSSGIVISSESLFENLEKSDIVSPSKDECQSRSEIYNLKEELEAANTEISDLRFRLEEAARKAELAEKVKEAIEEKQRKWREKQQQRRADSEARREQSARRYQSIVAHEKPRANYLTLGMILNIKL